jgi:hypothetical protein
MPMGSYLVRLHMLEPDSAQTPGNRPTNVAINGTAVLTNWDPATEAGGILRAVIPEFTAVADGSGGNGLKEKFIR